MKNKRNLVEGIIIIVAIGILVIANSNYQIGPIEKLCILVRSGKDILNALIGGFLASYVISKFVIPQQVKEVVTEVINKPISSNIASPNLEAAIKQAKKVEKELDQYEKDHKYGAFIRYGLWELITENNTEPNFDVSGLINYLQNNLKDDNIEKNIETSLRAQFLTDTDTVIKQLKDIANEKA